MNYRLPIMLLVATLSSTGLKAADKVEKPTFSKVTIPTTSNMFQGNHAFADMNADGKMDLLVKGRNLDNGWNPEAFALISTGQSLATKISFEISNGWHKVVTPIDYNNDGYPDMLLSASRGAELYRNDQGKKMVKVSNFAIEDLELDNDDNKDHCFGLANTFNPGAVKHGVHNVQCHHFSAVARRTIRQRQVLVKHFERVSEGQEQTNRDRRHHHRDSHVPKHTPLGRTI